MKVTAWKIECLRLWRPGLLFADFFCYLKLVQLHSGDECQVWSDRPIHQFPAPSDLVGVFQPFPLTILGLESQERLKLGCCRKELHVKYLNAAILCLEFSSDAQVY